MKKGSKKDSTVSREQHITKRQAANERFKKFLKPTHGGHELFTGAVFKDTGYGAFRFDYKNWNAHRWAYCLNNGITEIPQGKMVLHARSCPYRTCCAKKCLRLGDALENAADRVAIGKSGRGVAHLSIRFTDQEKQRIVEMTIQGCTAYRIAADLKRSQPSIAYQLKKLKTVIAAKLKTKAAEISVACSELSEAISNMLDKAA